MLTLTKEGQVEFQKYTLEAAPGNIGIEIVRDKSGAFRRKFYDNNDGCLVGSLYKQSSAVIINHFGKMIMETMTMNTVIYDPKPMKKDAKALKTMLINPKQLTKSIRKRKRSNDNTLNSKTDEFWIEAPEFLKDTAPIEIIDEIKDGVLSWLKYQHVYRTDSRQREILKYLHWKLFFPITQLSSTDLNFPQFLSSDVGSTLSCGDVRRSSAMNWSGLAFYFLTNENETSNDCKEEEKLCSQEEKLWNEKLAQVTRLTLGNSSLESIRPESRPDDNYTYTFKYELNESEWKTRLSRLLRKLPKLSEITFLNGVCDDDVICLVGKYCDRLKLKKVRICCEDIECADPERLTDEGMCEFIDRCSGLYQAEENCNPDDILPAALTHLDLGDCHYPNITAKTVSTLGKLKKLERVNLRLIHFQWSELFFSGSEKLEQNSTELCAAKVLCLSVGQTSTYHQTDIRENKGDEILERFSHVLNLFPRVEELYLKEVYGQNNFENSSNSIELQEFKQFNSIYKMATSLNLFESNGTNKCIVKSVHLKEGLFPLSTHTYSENGDKLVKKMNLLNTVEALHLQDFSSRSLMGITMLHDFRYLSKILISYGLGYKFLGSFPLKTVLNLIFDNVVALEELQMTGIKAPGYYSSGGTVLLKDEDLKDIITSNSNSRIRNNLRVFVINVDKSDDWVRFNSKPDKKLGLSIEKSAVLLQKECPNIERIGCLKSWSWLSRNNDVQIPYYEQPDISPVPLQNFLLPNFKLVQTTRNCDCVTNIKNSCCVQNFTDLNFEGTDVNKCSQSRLGYFLANHNANVNN